MDLILPKKEEAKAEQETSIDVQNDVMTVVINLKRAQVNCYGTLEFAKEMASRYFLTKELVARQQVQQQVQAEKAKVDEALTKIGVH